MKKHAHVLIHSHGRQPRKPVDPPITLRDLRKIERLLAQIKMTQAESAAQLRAVKEQNTKIASEITVLHEEIAALKEAAANQPSVTPELQEAIDSVIASSQALDEMNPDAPVPPVDPDPVP